MEGPGYQQAGRKVLIASSVSMSRSCYGKVWHDLIYIVSKVSIRMQERNHFWKTYQRSQPEAARQVPYDQSLYL